LQKNDLKNILSGSNIYTVALASNIHRCLSFICADYPE